MKKHKKLRSFLIIIFLLQFGIFHIGIHSSTQAAKKKTQTNTSLWPKCPTVDAEACCVMDLSSGLVLYSKNAKKKNYPASITKIMTTLLTIENCFLGEELTFSAQAVNSIPWDGSKLGVLAGEKLDVEQSLYAIMLQSANDVCAGAAEYISGSDLEFAKLMTRRAKEIGCVNTHFTNPHGLHDDKHYTCAYDMCLIGREAMKNSIFRQVTASKTYTVSATNMSQERTINNHHQMINGYRSNSIYVYENCIGGKTGYTSAAENTLVTFAKKDNMELVCVVMRAQGTSAKENQYTDTKKLLDAAFENYNLFSMAGSNTSHVESAISDHSPMFTKYNHLLSESFPAITVSNDSYIILPKGVKKKKAKQNIVYYPNITLSNVKADTIIGNVTYTYDGKNVGYSDILYHPSVPKTLTSSSHVQAVVSLKDKLFSGISQKFITHKYLFIAVFIVLGIILLLFLLYLLSSYIHYRKPNHRRRQYSFYLEERKTKSPFHRKRR